MTTTDVAGLPAAIRDVLYAARVAQEVACDQAGIARTSYYRRLEHPAGFRLGEVESLLAAAGYNLRLVLVQRTGAVESIAQAHGGTTVEAG